MHAGSTWPCTALTKIGSGLHAYWNRRSAAGWPTASATLPTITTTPTSHAMAGSRPVISQDTPKWICAQYAPASTKS